MLLDKVLDPPTYGWTDGDGGFSKPGSKQIFSEFFKRINVFKCRKNWLPLFSWLRVVVLVPLLFLFIFKFFSLWLLLAAFVYSMIVMGTHGTIWHHRYCTHKAYRFKNGFWRLLTQNLTISMVPEEIYAISHHVHHAKSDQPGDPYNANGGFLYCFLADVNHQPIAKDLTAAEYASTIRLLSHTGVTPNSYKGYQKWGSIVHPWRAIFACTLNWLFWYGMFFLIGGHGLACALFGAAAFWAIGVRTFNYEGHGKGKDKRKKGYDLNEDDMSVNQIWPGFVAGEWHNNHHLYPGSARSGFLPHQLDLAWCYIKLLHMVGAVTSYHDSKAVFLKRYREEKARDHELLALVQPFDDPRQAESLAKQGK